MCIRLYLVMCLFLALYITSVQPHRHQRGGHGSRESRESRESNESSEEKDQKNRGHHGKHKHGSMETFSFGGTDLFGPPLSNQRPPHGFHSEVGIPEIGSYPLEHKRNTENKGNGNGNGNGNGKANKKKNGNDDNHGLGKNDNGGNKGNKGGNKHKKRLCERKYTEYIRRIFPDEDDTAEDADDSEFDGRELAQPGEYPHMAALGFAMQNEDVDYNCGGSLISEDFIITAAHCTNFTGQTPTTVRIGDLNLNVEERNVEPQIRRVRRIFNHPDYNFNSNYNDISLLQLDSEVNFTEFVRPIRLWVHTYLNYGTAFAMGYGSTAFGKARTNRLTHLNLTIVANEVCNRQLPMLPETQNGIIESQICAQDFMLNRDTCQGDSGGPLQINLLGKKRRNRKHYHLIGITSYGLVCRSGYPSVYTRVSSFLDWIESVVWSNEY